MILVVVGQDDIADSGVGRTDKTERLVERLRVDGDERVHDRDLVARRRMNACTSKVTGCGPSGPPPGMVMSARAGTTVTVASDPMIAACRASWSTGSTQN